MKKLFAIVLAALMVLSLAACGGEPVPTTVPTTTAATTEPTTEPSTAPTTEPTTVPTTVPETTAPVEKDSKLGTVEGNTYTSAFLGITATLDADWTFATDEEMAQLRGMTVEAMTDESLAQMLETSGTVMDMYAMDADGRTLNVMLENLNVLQTLALTEEAYAESAVDQVPAALEGVGFENVTAEVTQMSFAGQTHAAIKVHAQIMEIDFYETLVVVKQGNYIACITVASYMEDTTAEVLDLFTGI